MPKKNPNSPARLRSASREVRTKDKAPLSTQVSAALPRKEWGKIGRILDVNKGRRHRA